MEFKILTNKERKLLRLVKTTEEDARIILDRNTPMLTFAESLPTTLREIEKVDEDTLTHGGSVGCPHCLKTCVGCGGCTWDAIFQHIPRRCFGATFGGVSVDIMDESFWSDNDGGFVSIHYGVSAESVVFDAFKIQNARHASAYRQQLRLVIRCLKGHIEWAEGKLDGTL